MTTPPGKTARGPSSGLAWSAFLGCSWTWGIGMFLPVLLVRDFGFAGFLVFAVPNMFGAAAMGRVLPDAQSSRLFVDRHRALCAAFSGVTIVFHYFFINWMTALQIVPAAELPMIAVLAGIMLLPLISDRGAVLVAWLVFAVSVTAFVVAAAHAPHAMSELQLTGGVPAIGLVGLAAVCLLGFLLCPYLDLTFHRARQATSPRQGVIAFVTGFGGCFTTMILFTLWYSGLVDQPPDKMNHFVLHVIGLHVAVQTAFTVAAHVRSLAAEWSPPTRNGLIAGLVPAVLLMLAGEHEFDNGEATYRLFLVFYGLIFPACLWIGPARRREVLASVLACVTAAPMYAVGFMTDRMLYLVPGVAVVLVGRLLSGRKTLTWAARSPAAPGEAPTTDPDVENRRAP